MPEPDREAYEAAERLVRAAHARAEEAARAAADGVPENGWSSGQRPGASGFPDLSALLALVDAARGAIPPHLSQALADALRDLLITILAVLDYSIEQLKRPPRPDPEVEDIPVR